MVKPLCRFWESQAEVPIGGRLMAGPDEHHTSATQPMNEADNVEMELLDRLDTRLL